MTGSHAHRRADRRTPDVWAFVTNPAEVPLPDDSSALRAGAARLADLISPALAAYLLAPASARLGAPLLDRDAVLRDRLFNKFALAQKRRWARCLVEAGIDVVFLKGFANAYAIYADPPVRAGGDLDILVHEDDLSRTIGLLSSHGFCFRPSPVNPWGMISDASFMPLVSADGACEIDIHVRPDCYPAHLSLTTARVFAEARTVAGDGLRFRAPRAEHALLLCVTNAAKDKFFLSSMTKVIDAILLLRTDAAALDWDRIVGLARDGAFFRPLASFFALLAALGAPMDNVPRALQAPPRGLRRVAIQGVIDDYRALFPCDVPLTTYLWREWLIGAEPRVALRNCAIRLRGLVRPSSGIPEEKSVETGNVLLPDRSGIRAETGFQTVSPNTRS